MTSDCAVTRRRWLAKKLARKGVAFAAWASGSLLTRAVAGTVPCIRVLTYHRFGESRRDPFRVDSRTFEAQMRWLAEEGLLVSLDDVERFLEGRKELGPNSVLVTIDDGSLSLHREALPILRDHRVPAVAFVIAGAVGGAGLAPGCPEPHVGWRELEDLCAAGLAIGSHALSHRSLLELSIEAARDEASGSKELLERRLGREVVAFAYPYGTRADFGPATHRVLAEVGYRLAFHSMHGAIRPGMDPLELPRIKIEGGEGLWIFQQSCRGAMDVWRGVDHALWRVQTSRRARRVA